MYCLKLYQKTVEFMNDNFHIFPFYRIKFSPGAACDFSNFCKFAWRFSLADFFGSSFFGSSFFRLVGCFLCLFPAWIFLRFSVFYANCDFMRFFEFYTICVFMRIFANLCATHGDLQNLEKFGRSPTTTEKIKKSKPHKKKREYVGECVGNGEAPRK